MAPADYTGDPALPGLLTGPSVNDNANQAGTLAAIVILMHLMNRQRKDRLFQARNQLSLLHQKPLIYSGNHIQLIR